MGDQRIGAAMIHRTEMRWLEASMPLDRARKIARESRQTSFALCRKNVDRIIGVISLRDLLPTEGPPVTDLKAIATPPLFVPESAPVLRVLERLRLASAPIAFVVDEYGAVQGQVTTRDILDQLVGKVFRVDAKTV
jgi:putative hemolysin